MKVRALVDTTNEIPAWLKWRITRPYAQLRKQDIDANIIWLDLNLPKEDNIDILVIPRLIVARWERTHVAHWLNKLRELGICLVFEADDDIWSESYAAHIAQISLQDTNNNVQNTTAVITLLNEMDARRDAALWMLNQCDAATASTPELANYMREISTSNVKNNIYVIPNAIDVELFERGLRVNDNNDMPTVGWFGGRRSIGELYIMIEAWKNVARYNLNIQFEVTSWLLPHLVKFEELQGRVTDIEWNSYESYSNNLQVDIGCCSVDESPFCARKSTIKSWEYALAGALPVGTKYLYGDELGTALTTNDVIEYAAIIAYYAQHIEERKQLVQIYKDHTYGYHDLRYEWRIWKEVYEQILNNKNSYNKVNNNGSEKILV